MKKILIFLLLFSANSLFGQTKKFTGEWTKVNTTYVFEFELTLTVKEANRVEGHFNWKVVQYDEKNLMSKAHYQNKLGKTATEYVRGIYYPSEGKYKLKGYRKDDPHMIIGIDTYVIIENKTGEIGGTTNANGSWLGRINGQNVEYFYL